MASFKAMMEAKNKKTTQKSPKDEVESVENNRGTIPAEKEMTPADKKRKRITTEKATETMPVNTKIETERIEQVKKEPEKKEPEKKEAEKKDADNKAPEKAAVEAAAEAAKQEKEAEGKQETVKINVSLSKTSVNYIRMNAKRLRIGQTGLLAEMIRQMKEDMPEQNISYDNFETRKRHIVDTTPLSLYFSKEDGEWIKDMAAENCISVSQFVDEAIQERIQKEMK